MTKNILQLKIVLADSRPLIWRRILVSAESTFFDLHVAIQDAFGWQDSHLHQFFTALPYGRNRNYQVIAYPMPEMEDVVDERKVKLSKWFKNPKDKLWYEYDFGDTWMHEITFEKVIQPESNAKCPQLVDGAQACPPEDCGGIGGYEHLLEVLANPKDEEHKDMLDWLGIETPTEFDPAHFDKKEVKFRDPQKVLKQYVRNMR